MIQNGEVDLSLQSDAERWKASTASQWRLRGHSGHRGFQEILRNLLGGKAPLTDVPLSSLALYISHPCHSPGNPPNTPTMARANAATNHQVFRECSLCLAAVLGNDYRFHP
ncbi:hypothetical protein A1O7_01312 [Cladophialophora yegresii CBS 114405]|uniref:Uncharacterized protein n=1 Tax=Cladophialophora yegresii CBS 114405 TaxID=1182544 RepID=W9WAL1_9EURO|nr:uncharacterized protein A1O7_01312 [Cladophialophora yegresii CBS 114405]EXJ64973.1 hypothetical protein A1O7_01312 [Cladophialophora yegresii CBS 114405]